MNQKLVLEQSQKLIMTQELRQAIELLTMPLLELNQFIERQIQENPILEVTAPDNDSESDVNYKVSDKSDEMISENPTYNWEEIAAEWHDRPYEKVITQEVISNRSEPISTNFNDLSEYLLLQLHIASVDLSIKVVGEYIIQNLSEDGYLSMSDKEISSALNVGVDEVKNSIDIIHGFDPTGICARTLEECLLLQVDIDNPCYDILCSIIANDLDMVASNKLPLLAKKYKLSIEDIKKLIDYIRHLNPKPGQQFNDNNVVNYVYPDVIIEKIDDEYVIIINDSLLPKLGINQYYMKIMKTDKSIDSDVKEYMYNKLNSAAWIIKGIQQRRDTIYKVAEAIIYYQHEFFDKGVNYMAPLKLATIAEHIGVHESTVSRAISNKYVYTPHGLFPLKFFFVTGVGGQEISNAVTNIKCIIKDIIDNENVSKPYSDSKIMELLANRNVSISRRTIAKYREDMCIPSASKRKQY